MNGKTLNSTKYNEYCDKLNSGDDIQFITFFSRAQFRAVSIACFMTINLVKPCFSCYVQ